MLCLKLFSERMFGVKVAGPYSRGVFTFIRSNQTISRVFYIFIGVVVTQLCTFVQTHQTELLR